ncbi:hypothetical protein EAI_13262 [Harpegnathos saltator]|uniref:Uncharacterized protein n=1 Tax=Harpegnathos saltator TaxID=610380 RepID=E2C4V4_HARSA|nr:hypothetical protein EAI_13262 [Harpegnathos saltator]
MVYVIILSVITAALGLYCFFFKDLDQFKNHGIPYLKPLPIVGNMGQIVLLQEIDGQTYENDV